LESQLITEQQFEMEKRLIDIKDWEINALQQDLEIFNNRREFVDNQIASIQLELERLTEQLNHHQVSLPFDVMINEVHVKHDAFVAAGSLLFTATKIETEK